MSFRMSQRTANSELSQYVLDDVKVTDRVIGLGTYGVVVELNYKGLKCAGKKMKESLLESSRGDKYTLDRFAMECLLLSGLKHPNLVLFLGIYFGKERETLPYLVVEYLPTNLSSCIDQYGILPKEIIYSILYDVSLGLKYLHCQTPPILHKSLTANNILLSSDLRAKISGVGEARLFDLHPHIMTAEFTHVSDLISYMPPEALELEPRSSLYDTPIDVFSFGVLIIHAFCGKWPHPKGQVRIEADGRMIVLTEVERREEYLRDIGQDHPLMDLILQCIKYCPVERPTAVEIVTLLNDTPRFPSLANKTEMLRKMEDQEKQGSEKDLKEKTIENTSSTCRLTSLIDLPGVETCAETTVTVTNSSQYFNWKGYGLTLHIPDGCLPTDVDQCVINIKASLAGQYEFPGGSHLVSAVYWLRCEPSCKFTKAISVEIEHCAPLENSSKLSIVRSHCTQKQLPYTFKKIGGAFTEQSSYGYIELDGFSGLAVTQTGSEEREYCAGLYYLEKKTMNPKIHFVITWNTEAHLTVIDKHYKSKGADPGPDFTVSFESDAISLDISPEGVTAEGGWRIIPLTSPPFVTKKEVDNYKPKRRIPSCQIQAFVPQTSTDVVPTLTHQVRLKGVRQSCSANSITISFIPGAVASSTQEVIEVEESGQESESNRPPRLKLRLLLKELNRISSEWENIGVFLEIDDGKLQALRREHSSPHDCLREMLRLWLKMVSPPPTWSNIVDAVKDVGDGALADELQQKYCS